MAREERDLKRLKPILRTVDLPDHGESRETVSSR
jgi:hypothetical protein